MKVKSMNILHQRRCYKSNKGEPRIEFSCDWLSASEPWATSKYSLIISHPHHSVFTLTEDLGLPKKDMDRLTQLQDAADQVSTFKDSE